MVRGMKGSICLLSKPPPGRSPTLVSRAASSSTLPLSTVPITTSFSKPERGTDKVRASQSDPEIEAAARGPWERLGWESGKGPSSWETSPARQGARSSAIFRPCLKQALKLASPMGRGECWESCGSQANSTRVNCPRKAAFPPSLEPGKERRCPNCLENGQKLKTKPACADKMLGFPDSTGQRRGEKQPEARIVTQGTKPAAARQPPC